MIGLESKAEAVRRAFAHPHYVGWDKKAVRDFAVANWKARRGNLMGRPHPSENMPWPNWRSVTEHRLRNRLARAAK